MKDLLRRWLGAPEAASDGEAGRAIAAWARGRGWRFAGARGGAGFVVENDTLRVEWGTPQRDYIAPAELRVRADLGDCGDLQMLLASRALMKTLEAEVFEQATEGNRTRMDDRTPEEMRWVVLYPKLPRAELGALAEHVSALANRRRAAALWLDEALVATLGKALARLGPQEPLVMVVQRGRFVLRRALAQPTVPALEEAIALAAVAVSSARAVCAEVATGALDSVQASAWGASSAMPPGTDALR
jgi:hypothetical protein